jgi:hypothetical protein
MDGQLADPAWLRTALPKWMTFGNVREMHNRERAVGKAQSLDLEHQTGPFIVAKIADESCWNKIEAGVFSGFSIGVKNARIVHDGRAPRGTIVGGDIYEVSVVDHPAVHKAAFNIVTKSADGGWYDSQSGMTFEDLPEITDEELLTKSVAPEPVEDLASRIGRLAYQSHIEDAPMNDPAELLKGAQADTEDAKEDGSEDPKANGKDAPKDDEDEEYDDYRCERCGQDARHCECYKNLTKAAADFEERESAKPIQAGHPIPKGSGNPANPHAAMHEDTGTTGGFLDSSDAHVRLDYLIKTAEHLVTRMQNALDSGNSSGFNPNDTEYHERQGPPAGDPNKNMGQAPNLHPKWQGQLASNVARKSAGPDTEDVYKIAAQVAYVALQEFFGNNGDITKGAQADPAQAAFAQVVTGIAENVAFNAFDQLSDRLAKVEKMAGPSKGIASTPGVHPYNAPISPPTDPLQRAQLEARLNQAVSAMPDEMQRDNAAMFFAGQFAQR